MPRLNLLFCRHETAGRLTSYTVQVTRKSVQPSTLFHPTDFVLFGAFDMTQLVIMLGLVAGMTAGVYPARLEVDCPGCGPVQTQQIVAALMASYYGECSALAFWEAQPVHPDRPEFPEQQVIGQLQTPQLAAHRSRS